MSLYRPLKSEIPASENVILLAPRRRVFCARRRSRGKSVPDVFHLAARTYGRTILM